MDSRIEQLQQRLRDRDVDIALLNHPPDVYYFAGTGTQSSLLVPATGDSELLVRINIMRAQRDATVETVRRSQGRESIVETIENLDDVETVGMALDVVPAQLVKKLDMALDCADKIVDISSAIHQVRTTKGSDEVAAIKEAAAISQECLNAVPDIIDSGLTEAELQGEMEKIKRHHGAETEMIYRGWNMRNNFGIVASGPNTAKISGFWITITGSGMHPGRPYGASDREIQLGDIIIVDHGTLVDGYHSDEARTYVLGENHPAVESDVEILFECLDAAVAAIEPGVPVGKPFERAREIAAEYDRGAEFMALGQYGVEYLGHGIGLEIDEPPLISPHTDGTFESGMTLALEPKFIYPDEWGATVEDTILVTDDGAERLTNTRRELIRC